MNQSNESRPGRRRMQPAPDVLEDRMVLSAGEGSTFAIMPGSVAGPGMVSSTAVQDLDPTLFTSPKQNGHIVLGIDVTPAVSTASGSASTTSTLKPEIISVKDSSGHVIHVQHSKYDPKVVKANKITPGDRRRPRWSRSRCPPPEQPANDYTVQVKGWARPAEPISSASTFPATSTGAGTVTKADIKTIKSEHGLTAIELEVHVRRRRQPRRRHQQHGPEDRPREPGRHRPRSARWSR